MKILLIQLSDIHCCNSFNEYNYLITQAVNTITKTDSYDKIVLIFSGDLTNSAHPNEFKTGRKIISAFLSKLSKKFDWGFIETLIVPGNHDMCLKESDRTINDILNWKLKEHLDEETDRLDYFFQYAKSKNCFLKNKISDYKILDFDGYKIKVTLLNSAPFSTLEHDNKEVHFIPVDATREMERDGTADFYLTVIHHGYEWFDWDSKELLKKKFQDQDLVFVGHDHKSETMYVSDGNGNQTNMIIGGELSTERQEFVFNTVAIDSQTNEATVSKYTWMPENLIFNIQKQSKSFNAKGRNKLRPSDDFLSKLSIDNSNISDKFTDYYVFPKFKSNSEYLMSNSENIDIDNIFEILLSNKIIPINGNSRSGKSSLIKYLYLKSVEKSFFPLLIEKNDYRDNRIEKMFKDLVESQYGENEYIYNRFQLVDSQKVIIFIDDFDLITNSKARENLFTYILNHNYLLVYTTKDYLSQDLMSIVKQKIQNNSIDYIEILPFFKEKRDELIHKTCVAIKQDNKAVIDSIILALDYMVQCRADLFSLTPGNLLQYIKYFISNSSSNDKGNKTISIVFETNIRNAIINTVQYSEINTYLSALEFMANYMYFTELIENISSSQLKICIANFNESRRAHLNAKNFADNCCKAKILISSDTDFSYKFIDKNTYAYFVAKYVNWEIEKNPNNRTHINYIMEHICFGINDIIVLFLSYVRSNSRIILEIASKATELLSDTPELNFDENNIEFIKYGKELPKNSLPSEKDKEMNIKKTEQIEKSRQEAVRFKGIFDFSEEDINKKKYRVLRAFKYTQIIARALADQYGGLENDEITGMTHTLYSVTQKVLFAILKPYQDNYQKGVEELYSIVQDNPEIKLTKEETADLLNKSAIMLILNIMNDIAYNASNQNTIPVLCEIDLKNTNYKIQNLMMWENCGNTKDFISNASKLYNEYSSKPFERSLISNIAYKHIINNSEIDRREIDRLISSDILKNSDKKDILIKGISKNEN